MDVVVGGIKERCSEKLTNLQEEVTKGGKLPYDGHVEEDTYQNSDLRDENSRKTQQKKDTQKIHEKQQQIENVHTTYKDVHKRKQNRESESKISLSSYKSAKEMGNSVMKGNVENTPRRKNKPSKQKMRCF